MVSGGGHVAIRAASVLIALALGPCVAPERSSDLPRIPLGLDIYVPVPEDNRITAEKIALGRRLFFDPILWVDGTVACASCHRPERAFADTVPRAVGVHGRVGRRNAPSLFNVAYARALSWDGRAGALEEQAVLPITDSLEMALPLDSLLTRLRVRRGYRSAFRLAFEDGISEANLARALATYLRTLRSGDSPVDRFRAGDDSVLSAEARRGFELFIGNANCSACHIGPTFTDEGFHNTGVSWGGGDLGRFAVTGREEDRGAFNTPSLRNVARTAPYMHDGSIATLEDVVEFYHRGGGPNPYLDGEIRPLGLTADEKRALVAFLRALTGESS